MNTKNITFNKFTWLDFRTTTSFNNYNWQKNPIWFQELYWIIKEWVIHPLPNFTEIDTFSWRLFKVENNVYWLSTDWLYQINDNWKTQLINTTYQDRKDYRNVFKILYKQPSSIDNWTCADKSSLTYIKTATNIWSNVYAWLLIEIKDSWWNSKWVYYINANDTDTIYIEWEMDYMPWPNDTYEIYIPASYLTVYDWRDIYIYDETYNLIDSINLPNWFVANWNNRLITLSEKKIQFSTIQHAGYFPKLNYIYTTWTIKDIKWFSWILYIFTTDWIYELTWTWYQTMNLRKVSEQKINNFVYPIENKWRLFIMEWWWIYTININRNMYSTQAVWQEYNYRLIADTYTRMFEIDEWIVFNLWHNSNKYWLLNIEETINTNVLSISNYIDWNLESIVDINWKQYAVVDWKLYKEDWTQIIRITINKLAYSKKMFMDKVSISTWWEQPPYIFYNIWNWQETTNIQTIWHDIKYTIHKWSNNITLSIEAISPILSFDLSVKI